MKRDKRIRYIPTPEEIRKGCQAVQSTWSAKERAARERWCLIPWFPAVVGCQELVGIPSARLEELAKGD
jgi:hypothetical protein